MHSSFFSRVLFFVIVFSTRRLIRRTKSRVVIKPSKTLAVVKIHRKDIRSQISAVNISSVMSRLPDGAIPIKNKKNLFMHNGIFYKLTSNEFQEINPPVGIIVGQISSSTPFIFRSRTYFFNNGVFFTPYKSEYKVARPPVGAIVSRLPADSLKIIFVGRIYYIKHSVLYKIEETELGLFPTVAGYVYD